MEKYKESFFNIEIKKDVDGRTLVYNTNSTALSWFTEDVYKSFKDKTSICKDEILQDLIKHGFVVNSNIDEISLIEFQRQQYLYNRFPSELRYVIAPTMKCNMKCEYCFENNILEKNTMSLSDAKIVVTFILEQLKQNINVKKIYIFWFGGEPCLEMDIIKYISQELIMNCEQKGIKYNSTMVTNGFYLNRENALFLKEICHIRYVQITLDGMAKSYANAKGIQEKVFYEVTQNIVNICDVFGVNVRINITKSNKEEILDLCEYLLKRLKLKGKIEIYFAHVRGYGTNNRDNLLTNLEFQKLRHKLEIELIDRGYIDSIQHSLKERAIVSCASMQMMSAAIGPDLRLYRCEHCFGIPEYSIGTCIEGFYRNKIDNDFLCYHIPQKCKKCKYFPACATGCREDQVIQKRTVECKAIKNRLVNNIETYVVYKEKVKNKEITKNDIFSADD